MQSSLKCLERSGHVWTWNNRAINNRIACQLDHAIGNSKWFEMFPSMVAEGSAASTSDQLPDPSSVDGKCTA